MGLNVMFVISRKAPDKEIEALLTGLRSTSVDLSLAIKKAANQRLSSP
jgi:hypothetical protein